MNPLFMQNNAMSSGWYTPLQTYDMCSGSQWGAMNIHMNMNMDNMIAQQNLYNVPIYSFNNFMPYSTMGGGMDYLTDLRYTLGQADWANRQNGGPGYFNENGQLQMPSFGSFGTGSGWGGAGWAPGTAGTTPSSPSTKADTPEERLAQRKYNTLLPLVKQLAKYDKLSINNQVELENITRNNKGKTWEEKFQNLKEQYDKIDKSKVKEFLIKSDLVIGNSSDKSNSFFKRLMAAGYEYADMPIDDLIPDLHTSITRLSNSNANPESDQILGSLQAGGTAYDILDVLSSWNTKYKGTGDRNLITYITKYYNNITDPSMKSTAKSKVLDPIVNRLCDKAREIRSGLDESSKDTLNTAIKNAEDALSKSTNGIDSALANAFDNLYILTRKAAISQLRNDIKNQYGEIDPSLFNDNLFEAETTADLNAEGFNAASFKTAFNAKISVSSEEKKEETSEQKAAEDKQALQTFLNSKTAVKPTSKKLGNYTIYEETNETGDRNYKRLFYVKDGVLYEYTNTKLDQNGKIIHADATKQAGSSVEVNYSDIQADYDEHVAAEQSAGAEDRTEDGKKVWDLLTGWTDGNDDEQIAFELDTKRISKDNVLSFLQGVYSSKGSNHEGLMELLDDDTSSKVVTMDMKKNIIKSTLAKAKEMGLDKEYEYKKLKEDFDKFDTGKFKDCKTFNKTKDYLSSTWIIGTLWGSWTNYNESIDKNLEALYKKMNPNTETAQA